MKFLAIIFLFFVGIESIPKDKPLTWLFVGVTLGDQKFLTINKGTINVTVDFTEPKVETPINFLMEKNRLAPNTYHLNYYFTYERFDAAKISRVEFSYIVDEAMTPDKKPITDPLIYLKQCKVMISEHYIQDDSQLLYTQKIFAPENATKEIRPKEILTLKESTKL